MLNFTNKIHISCSKVLILVLLLLLLGLPLRSMALTAQKTNMPVDQWINNDWQIEIDFDEEPSVTDSPIRILINDTDVTDLFNQFGRKFVYQPQLARLPSGESTLIIYQVKNHQNWIEVGRVDLQVLSPMGFQQSEFNATVNMNIKSQNKEGISGDAVESERPRYNDLVSEIGLGFNASKSQYQVDASMNILGSSNRQEALRFFEKNEDAAKLDLSDYVINVNSENSNFSLGNVQYGENRLLVAGFGSRGIVYKHRFNGNLDISASSMNATQIVGFANILGQINRQHNVSASTLGYEFYQERPGALRAEISYLTASITPEFGFDVGEIPIAEKNKGFGLRLLASNQSGRLSGELGVARSKYLSPKQRDFELDLDDTVVKTEETSDSARYLEFNYNIYSGESTTIGARFSHQKVDPLFKSVAASIESDKLENLLELSMQLQDIGLQLSTTHSEDNLANIDTILKTKTRNSNFSADVPLGVIMGATEGSNPAFPSLQFSYARVHQFGTTLPVDFQESHVPDQLSQTYNLGMQWILEKTNIEYQFSRTKQDNRQQGRNNADFENRGNAIVMNVMMTELLSLNTEINRNRAFSVEENTTNYDDNVVIGMNWQLSKKLTFRSTLNKSKSYDSNESSVNRSFGGQTQLSGQYELSWFGSRLTPVQFFISHNVQGNESQDNVFNLSSQTKIWTLSTGININVY